MKTIPLRPFATAKLMTLAGLAFLLLLLNGCHWVGVKGDGNVLTQNRQVENFTKVEADGGLEIKWSTGAPACSITTDENLFEYIRTRSSGDTLKIDWIKPLRGTKGIKITISSSTLTGAQLQGAVKFTATKLSTPDFYLDATGATKVTLDGSATGLTASMTGASRLEADSLQTQTAELSITGAGKAEVMASETLKVAISGAGKVTYGGNPKTVNKEISGAGSVKRKF